MQPEQTLMQLQEGISAGLHTGGQLFVAAGGETIFSEGFGEARPGEPMRPDHMMLWLSASKPITAVAIGRLWEQGHLDIESPVAEFVPEFAQGGKHGVTVRHLLTHTGGIRKLGLDWPRSSWESIIEQVSGMKLEPRWVPGRKAGYHLSSSWFILGEIIRRVTSTDPSDFIRSEVFEPLGMTDCWVGMPPEVFSESETRLAPVYNTEKGGTHPWTDQQHLTHCSPGGNGIGPMEQLGRFYGALLAGGQFEGQRVLTPQTVSALTARHRVGFWDHTFRHTLDWGLGFILNSRHYDEATVPYGYGAHSSLRTFGHSGYRSTVALADPVHDVVVCLAVNGTPSDEDHLRRFNQTLDALYHDLGLVSQ